jgi:hypothetical protein
MGKAKPRLRSEISETRSRFVEGLSIRQLARPTGINRDIVLAAGKRPKP